MKQDRPSRSLVSHDPEDRFRRAITLRGKWLAAFAALLAVLVIGRAIRLAAVPDPDAGPVEGNAPHSLKIAVNTADPDELRLLPGVGAVLALRIVEHRERHGPFASMEDLEAVSGVGRVTRQRLRPWITTNPATP